MMHQYDHDYGIGTGAWVGMGFMMLLLLAVAVWAVWMLTRDRAASAAEPARAAAPAGRETPEELLQRRLAEGAIAPEEYRARLAALRGEDPPPPG